MVSEWLLGPGAAEGGPHRPPPPAGAWAQRISADEPRAAPTERATCRAPEVRSAATECGTEIGKRTGR